MRDDDGRRGDMKRDDDAKSCERNRMKYLHFSGASVAFLIQLILVYVITFIRKYSLGDNWRQGMCVCVGHPTLFRQ